MDDELTEPGDAPLDMKEVRRRLFAAMRKHKKWEKAARRWYEYYDGHQWDEDDLRRMSELRRPALTYNRIAPIVDAGVGAMASAALETKFQPRTLSSVRDIPGADDQGLVDALNSSVKYFRQACSGDEEEFEMDRDLVISGLAWTHTRLDFDEDPDGAIITEHKDNRTVFCDPNACKRNLIDMEYVFARVEMSKQALRERWPDKVKEIMDFSSGHSVSTGFEAETHRDDKTGASLVAEEREDMLAGRYPVYEYQWWEIEEYYMMADGSEALVDEYEAIGQQIKDDDAELSRRISENEAIDPLQRTEQHDIDLMALHDARPGIEQRAAAFGQAVPMTRRVYMQATFCGEILLEAPQKLGYAGFTYLAKTGKYDRKEKYFYGIVRPLIDPQQYANKTLSTSVDILQSHPKANFFIEEDALPEDEEEFKRSLASHSEYTKLAPGSISGGRVLPKSPPAAIPQMSELLNHSIQAIMDVSPVNPTMLGKGGASTPGVTASQYVKQGFGLMAVFFISSKTYRQRLASITIELMAQLPDATIARIIEMEAAPFIAALKDPKARKYDIVVSEGPASPNMQAEILQSVQMFLPTLEKMGVGPQVLIPLLPYLPLPASLKSEFERMLGAAPPGAVVGGPGPQLPNMDRGQSAPPSEIPQGNNGAPVPV